MSADQPAYLPPSLRDGLRFSPVAKALPDDQQWALHRLVEQAWADGYAAGHRAGYDEGWTAGKAQAPDGAGEAVHA